MIGRVDIVMRVIMKSVRELRVKLRNGKEKKVKAE